MDGFTELYIESNGWNRKQLEENATYLKLKDNNEMSHHFAQSVQDQ